MDGRKRNPRNTENLSRLIGKSWGPIADLSELVMMAKKMSYKPSYHFREESHNDLAGYEKAIIDGDRSDLS